MGGLYYQGKGQGYADGSQDRERKDRPAKVIITTDLDGDATRGREIPFVLAVLADLLGDKEQTDEKGDQVPLKQRSFTDITKAELRPVPGRFADPRSRCS